MTGIDPTGPAARRFPLMARPRPACPPLHQRVADLRDRAHAAERDSDMAAASAVHNLAALLASDVGLPDLARQWCHRHATVYLHAGPLSAKAAIRALEPLVNLARLHIRDGNGERAFTLLDALYTAVTSRADTTIDGIALPAATLTACPDAHQEVRRWLWAVLLATGARALASAGRWDDACTQLHRHKGIGRRIFDGRQVAVLARATAGDTDGALALLADTLPGEPWENAVTACLTALCHQHTDQPTDRSIATLLGRYRQLDTSPGLAVFHTRLGLSVIDATGGIEHRAARRIATDLLHQATTARDGYTARELLGHDGCVSMLTNHQAHDLAETVNACALGSRAIPAPLQADLSAALDTGEAVLTRALKHQLAQPSSSSIPTSRPPQV
ncbi:MAG: hypothetical protein ACRDR6_25370 [Pseudonocardiaceae bacterium]